MDFNYIENFLINILDSSEEFTRNKLKELVLNIRAYKQKEDELESISTVFTILHSYTVQFVKLLDEYRTLDNSLLLDKTYKAQEILCTISCIDCYITDVLNRDCVKNGENRKDTSKLYKTIYELKEKKEYFKSEKFSWCEIIKTLRMELEMQKVKLEIKKLEGD